MIVLLAGLVCLVLYDLEDKPRAHKRRYPCFEYWLDLLFDTDF
jgi:hypothetical protein